MYIYVGYTKKKIPVELLAQKNRGNYYFQVNATLLMSMNKNIL